jgi:hypothetical protein
MSADRSEAEVNPGWWLSVAADPGCVKSHS